METLTRIIIKLRWPIIVGFIGVTAGFASQIRHAQVDPRVKTMLPEGLPSRAAFDAIEEIFGATDMMMVSVSAEDILEPAVLRRVRALSRKLERIKAEDGVKPIDRVMSLFTLKEIRSVGGEMVVEAAVLKIPKTSEEKEALRRRLQDNDLIYGNVLSEDFKATVIIGLLDGQANDNQTMARVEEIIAESPGPGTVQIAGMPFVRTRLARYIGGDMQKLLPLGILIMLFFLFICFRQIRGVLLPFFVVVMAILFSVGLMPLVGWKITIITVILPIIMVAVANDYGIHLYARYQEENVPGDARDKVELARSVLAHLGKPVLFTGITTMVGLLCLLSHVIVPAQQMGVLAAAGVAYALGGSLLFIPAMLSLLPRAKAVAHASGQSAAVPILERFLRWNAASVAARPGRIVGLSVAVALATGAGIGLVEVDTNPIKFFPETTDVRQSADLVNAKFGGSTSLGVVAKGDVKDPALLAEIRDLQAKLDALPIVGQTSSIVDVVERMNRAVHDGAASEERLPETREAVAQYFLTYSMSGEPEDFDRLVDFPFEHALLSARINTLATKDVGAVIGMVNGHLAERPEGPFTLVGGFAGIFTELVNAIVRGQILSLLFSLLMVGLLVAMMFRSLLAGVLGVAPLFAAMAVLFGLMGYFEIELNHITAMLSSIMIGVGVDYTIHFLWRFREERRRGLAPPEAVRVTLTTSGRGIVFNALSVVVGFTALLISGFLPVQFFGFLVVVTIGACLLGALVLLPAITLLVRPRFLNGAAKSGAVTGK